MRRTAPASRPRNTRTRPVAASILALALGVGCRPSTPSMATHAPSAVPVAKSAEPRSAAQPRLSLADLSYVLGVKSVVSEPPATTVDGYRAWVRARLAEAEIYDSLAPRITALGTSGNSVTGFLGGPIKSDRGRDFYFHNAAKCTDKDLVAVRPWWAPDTEVLVCKNDYRPERIIGKLGKTACDVTYGGGIHPIQECGCGPNLIFCSPFQLGRSIDEAMVNEVRDTIRHVVENDRPFGEILTTNQTVRSGKADFWYNRVEFYRTGKFDFPDLTKPSRLLTRPDYFAGGILSSYPMLFADGPRSNTAVLFGDFLCVPMRSAAVFTDRIVEVAHGLAEKAGDLRSEPVLELAKTEGCQNCHAKLENGFIARSMWKSNLNGLHLSSGPPKYTTMQFYVRSHKDLRAEGPANLGWFGETMRKQPEFPACMTSKIASWLYEGQSAPPDVMDTLLSRFEQGQNMKQLIEDAVIARAFGRAAIDSSPPRRDN